MSGRKKKELTGYVIGVRDTSNGSFYKWDDFQSNPELKKYIEEGVRRNMERSLSQFN